MIKEAPTTNERLAGKDLESIVVSRCDQLKTDRIASIGRYGVQAARMKDDWMIMQSLPDFEGAVAPDGRQVIFDCKVCSQASWSLTKYRADTNGARARQLRHMYDRSNFGAVCFFLIHWNPRELKTKSREAATFAFPVSVMHPFWTSFEAGERKSMSFGDCEQYACPVPWCLIDRERKPRPDLMRAIKEIGSEMQQRREWQW